MSEVHGPLPGPVGGPAEQELPAELRSLEAALAALSPRDDRLDHDLVLFRAGQLAAPGPSAASAARRGSRRAIWALSGALAGMTALATALAVLLLVRPGPQVIERVRIVEVPRSAEPARPPEQPEQGTTAPGDRQGPAETPRPEQRGGGSSYLAGGLGPDSAGSTWLGRWLAIPVRTAQLQRIEQALGAGAKGGPSSASPSATIRDEPPRPYLEMLQSMLPDQARAEPPRGWPARVFAKGANS